MAKELTFVYEDVYDFVKECFAIKKSISAKGIGLLEDGRMIAGMVFDDYNWTNIWGSVAAVPGSRWLNREFLYACFAYPFIQLGCKRMTTWVEASNEKSRRFAEHLGFKQEAVLKGAATDGGDVIIYAMFSDECRFIRNKENV